jgi:hypothetical protein
LQLAPNLKKYGFILFLNFGNLAFQTWPMHDGKQEDLTNKVEEVIGEEKELVA